MRGIFRRARNDPAKRERVVLWVYAMSPAIYGREMRVGTTGVGASDHNKFARLRPELMDAICEVVGLHANTDFPPAVSGDLSSIRKSDYESIIAIFSNYPGRGTACRAPTSRYRHP